MKKTESIPIPKNNSIYNRVGINEVNEIDGINQKIKKQEKSYENLRQVLSSDSIIPPSDFSPNTPPEHNLIYSHMYNNDCNYINKYNDYGLKEDLVLSL